MRASILVIYQVRMMWKKDFWLTPECLQHRLLDMGKRQLLVTNLMFGSGGLHNIILAPLVQDCHSTTNLQ